MTTGQDECGMCAPPATGANVLPKPHPHPRYNNKAARLRTFEDWPKSMKQKPEELAEAGFYYTGQSDKTKCFYCDGGLKDWEEDDVPWEQHARWFDRCAYVQLVKGEDYVQKVMSSQKGKVIIAPNKASNSASTSQAHSGTGAMITIIITVDTTGQKATTRTVQWATKTPALESIDWQAVVAKHSSECKTLATTVINILTNLLNIHLPLKPLIVRPKQNPWIDNEIQDLKALAFEFTSLSIKYPDNIPLHDASSKLQKCYHYKLKTKRSDYFNSIINNNPNKSRAMWKAINIELARAPRDRVDYTELLVDSAGRTFATKQLAVDALNHEFVTAATACGAPAADRGRCISTLSNGYAAADCSLRLKAFTPDEVVNLFKYSVAAKNSSDAYGLSTNLLKQSSPAISYVLSHLFNNCMRSGVYPESLKKVKICPLYKGKGKKSIIKSYRPIALIPGPSKCFEAGLNKRLLSFWAPRNALSESQYAYRQGRSTTDLVREVVRGVLSAREAERHVAVICCDLSRAFDTADHALVADKLAYYGIRGPANKLILSFMTDRAQVVVGAGGSVVSAELRNLMGVPQGSCLSNTLFSVLLNDLPKAIKGAEIFMYADDVTAVVTTSAERELEGAINDIMEQLHKWFQSNGLAMNKEKTCFMTFKLNGHPSPTLKVCAGGAPIQQVSCTRLLGFQLDSALTWESHIDELCGRLGRACYALRCLANTAGLCAVRKCYYATMHLLLTYGVELWARASDWNRVFVMQKRAVRIMAGKPADAPARDLFRDLNILPLPCLYLYQVAVFTHENLDKFKLKGTNDNYHLRSNEHKNRLVAETPRLTKSQRSVYCAGPSVYNRLPDNVRNAATTAGFKYKLKMWLTSEVFYDYAEYFNLPIMT
ncbi:uncharacterized protein LOC134676740 [Cydia fagiglandana]|uniref:uncharacterized protein LOC134676740 n=1 Tax=Cydia fagiglandana TaxID=1458189 RepID=UPI002FEE3839